ncbi:hypothetical protein RRG08_066290 [Elysia crispata]|uniref:Uncharacterized protein n=1 Tax=Elysia crispata TaxID=231223 RepID=A0AAE1AMQ8_9GAST|nr:hypothetical protein RRG08_066290 [Elysia crispata]
MAAEGRQTGFSHAKRRLGPGKRGRGEGRECGGTTKSIPSHGDAGYGERTGDLGGSGIHREETDNWKARKPASGNLLGLPPESDLVGQMGVRALAVRTRSGLLPQDLLVVERRRKTQR